MNINLNLCLSRFCNVSTLERPICCANSVHYRREMYLWRNELHCSMYTHVNNCANKYLKSWSCSYLNFNFFFQLWSLTYYVATEDGHSCYDLDGTEPWECGSDSTLTVFLLIRVSIAVYVYAVTRLWFLNKNFQYLHRFLLQGLQAANVRLQCINI